MSGMETFKVVRPCLKMVKHSYAKIINLGSKLYLESLGQWMVITVNGYESFVTSAESDLVVVIVPPVV